MLKLSKLVENLASNPQKLVTIVGILTFISRINFSISSKKFITSGHGLTQTCLYIQSQKKAKRFKFSFQQEEGYTIYEAKTKMLISCAVTAMLICLFVFTYEKSGFPVTRLTGSLINSN